MHLNTPPQKPLELIKSFIVAEHNSDRLEPHIVFISHNISRSMKDQLIKENKDFNQFINEVCREYLKQQKKEEISLTHYIAFSEMQLFEFSYPMADEVEDDSLDNEILNLSHDSKEKL